MFYHSQIKAIKETREGTELIIKIPEKIKDKLSSWKEKGALTADIRFNDNRYINREQQKRIYATIEDISRYTGNPKELEKMEQIANFCWDRDIEYFSLSNCSKEIARDFTDYLIQVAISLDIPLTDLAINRAEDIDRYLWICLDKRICCICGRKGEIHHVQAIGMGRDRKKVDDSEYLKMCLCREHHIEYHKTGRVNFENKHHVHGVKYKED
ncbi:protein of unknown function DUF968 [Gottschalkia purinilytica]|uniref:Phage protein n=1 Tax=Gottschalkia purinilytica TaxID=1503 RepID=A0A0L0W686_GOTPU|nr:putative HNHc nuclease [Gottschalkia purinilytica]KNF06987.1 protein of unknown function DUF968 [Gottschalkia purinilytica]